MRTKPKTLYIGKKRVCYRLPLYISDLLETRATELGITQKAIFNLIVKDTLQAFECDDFIQLISRIAKKKKITRNAVVVDLLNTFLSYRGTV